MDTSKPSISQSVGVRWMFTTCRTPQGSIRLAVVPRFEGSRDRRELCRPARLNLTPDEARGLIGCLDALLPDDG